MAVRRGFTVNILAVERKALRPAHIKKETSVKPQWLMTNYSLNGKNFVVAITYHASKTVAEVISNIIVLVTKESEF